MSLSQLFNTHYTTVCFAFTIPLMILGVYIGTDPLSIALVATALVITFHAGMIAGADVVETEYTHTLLSQGTEIYQDVLTLLAIEHHKRHADLDYPPTVPCDDCYEWARKVIGNIDY